MYETFDHTADLGLRVRAPDLDRLFAEAAEAMFSVIVEDLGTVRPDEAVELHIDGEQHDDLLYDWLKELLYHFDAEHRLFSRFEVKLRPGGLDGRAWGERLDRDRHELSHEVKAVTYHGLKVEPADGGWLAEVIVDI